MNKNTLAALIVILLLLGIGVLSFLAFTWPKVTLISFGIIYSLAMFIYIRDHL